jgi:hypothetical protein
LQFGGYIDHTRHMWPSDRLADGSNIVVPGLTEDELTAKIVPPAPAASHAKGVAALAGLFVGTPKYAVTPLRGKGVTAEARSPRPRVTSASAP